MGGREDAELWKIHHVRNNLPTFESNHPRKSCTRLLVIILLLLVGVCVVGGVFVGDDDGVDAGMNKLPRR